MADEYRVDCSRKTGRPGAHECISAIGGYLGGQLWVHTQETAIANIESRTAAYYVDRPKGNRVNVIIGTLHGKKYLKTQNDGDKTNNLAELPNC